jgi:hypothetical protein
MQRKKDKERRKTKRTSRGGSIFAVLADWEGTVVGVKSNDSKGGGGRDPYLLICPNPDPYSE